MRKPDCIIILITVICGLWAVDSGLIYAQNAQLTVPGDVTTETIILDPQGFAPAADEGKIYYKDDPDNQPYYHNGTAWQAFGAGGDLTVATKIVAASNSLDTSRADYVCDGTDDQLKIQEAIDALGANPVVVYLLEGTYNISGSINLDNTYPNDSGKAIIGAGKGTVLQVVTGASNVNVINISKVDRIFISQLMIDGNSKTGTNNNGIALNGSRYSKLANLWIENISSNGIFINSGITHSFRNIITNNHIRYSAFYGIYAYATYCIDYNILSNNVISDNDRYGIYAKTDSAGCAAHFNYNTISNNIIQNNGSGSVGGGGIYIDGSGEQARNNIISNNIIQSNNADGINLYYSVFNVISNNIITSNSNGNGIVMQRGCWIDEVLCSETTRIYGCNSIIGNIIAKNAYKGIIVNDSNANVIVSNIFADNSSTGSERSNIYISLSNNNVITANRIMNSLAGVENGIRLWSGSDNYLSGNMISGSYSGSYAAPIYDNGTNTTYTGKEKINLEEGTYTVSDSMLTPSGPTSYLRLTSGMALGNPAIADGKAEGDILILENKSSDSVSINDNSNVQLHAATLNLDINDVLILVWDGSDWVEIGYSNN